ncbi:mavicyanin-like [Olea europaea var. sylvestris]|uniref:mavicyanin-like n=1 Tax=Olea europaea var. sylvestris TaxID=158386 RepID=UPI000C1D4C98|nr:mavicyanin-like [Olea europaea var. sylvestris]
MAMASAYLLFLVLLSPVVFAKDINVGDDNGWTNGIDYSNWVSSQKFNVGDKLVFTFGITHSLAEVSKDDYDNCNTGNPIKSYSSSPTSITLKKAGTMYFTCPRLSHCSQGMKLAINVTPTSTTPGGSPPPSPPSATTPSPPSETTPSRPRSPTTPDSPLSRPSTTVPPTPTGGATSIFGGFSNLMVVLVACFVFVA